MMTFDYLCDPVPDAIERLRALRVPPYLITMCYTAATSAVVLICIIALLHVRLLDAHSQERLAEDRFDASRIQLADAKLERTHVEWLLNLDRQLRTIRLSGVSLASRLADIANHLPQRAWLSGITITADGSVVDGEAEGLAGLGDTVESLMSSRTANHPRLVHAAMEDPSHGIGVLAFELQAEDRAP